MMTMPRLMRDEDGYSSREGPTAAILETDDSDSGSDACDGTSRTAEVSP